MTREVDQAIGIMKGFADERELGKPLEIVTSDPQQKWINVGAKWNREGQEPIWNVVACRSETSHEDAAEIKRRLEEWIAA